MQPKFFLYTTYDRTRRTRRPFPPPVGPLCTGLLILRNCPRGVAFMEEMAKFTDPRYVATRRGNMKGWQLYMRTWPYDQGYVNLRLNASLRTFYAASPWGTLVSGLPDTWARRRNTSLSWQVLAHARMPAVYSSSPTLGAPMCHPPRACLSPCRRSWRMRYSSIRIEALSTRSGCSIRVGGFGTS